MSRKSRRSFIFNQADDGSDNETTMESEKNTLTAKQEEYIQNVEKEKHDWKKYLHQLKKHESSLKTEQKNHSNFDFHKYLKEYDLDLLKRCELYEQEYLKKYDLDELKLEINDIKEAVDEQKKEVSQILEANQNILFKLTNLQIDDKLDESSDVGYETGIEVNLFSDEEN